MAFRPLPPRVPPPKPPPGKLNFFVVNPVFQNWCQDGDEQNKGALAAPRYGGQRVYKNFGQQSDNWNLPDEQPSIHESDVDLTETKVVNTGTNRIVILVTALTCLVSITSLTLTVLILFGKVGERCACTEKQASTQAQEAKPSANSELIAMMRSLKENVTNIQASLALRSKQMKDLEKSYKNLQTKTENLRKKMVNSSQLEQVEVTLTVMHNKNEHLAEALQQLGMNFTAYYAIAGQTVKKLDGFQNRTDGVLSVWNSTIANLAAHATSAKALMSDLNSTLLQKLNRLHSYITVIDTVTNQTDKDFKTFKNITENSLVLVLNSLENLKQTANTTKEQLLLSIFNTSNQLKQTTDRLHQEDINLRLFLTEVNNTLLMKVINVSKLQGPVGPPGFNGSQGPTGPRGFNGSQGIKGLQGWIGPQGFNGTQGPQGPAGPQGPQGAGDFSSCEYKTASHTESQQPVSSNIHNSAVKVILAEPNGKRIVGVSCSTDLAQMYLLSSVIGPGSVRYYYCDCLGHYGSGPVSVTCTMSYWQCPLTS